MHFSTGRIRLAATSKNRATTPEKRIRRAWKNAPPNPKNRTAEPDKLRRYLVPTQRPSYRTRRIPSAGSGNHIPATASTYPISRERQARPDSLYTPRPIQ